MAMPTADPLDEFSSELATVETPAQPRPPEAIPQPAAAALVSLEDILQREVPINWDEAVAVVEDVCALLAPAEAGVPDAADLFITDGAVVQRQRARAQSDVTGAGRLLHSLLSTASNTPVPLRLFVTQASAQGAYASIAAFASALAYFGKPARRELIRTLYLRCTAAANATAAPVHAPEPKRNDPPAPAPQPARPRRAVPLWAIASLAAIVLSVVGVRLWLMRSNLGTEATLPSLIADVREAMGKLVNGNSPAEQTEPPAAVAPPARADARADTRVDHRPAEAPHLVSRTIGSPSAPRRPSPRRPSPSMPVLVAAPQSAELSARNADEAARAAIALTIYSSRDADVEPPLLLYPQIPTNLMLAGENRLNIMELLISETGSVEQVRLVAGPSRLPDVMLLSGAKAWRFQPASREGEPVRYRALVSWAGTP
jgi:hypothetical protein